MTFVDGTTPTTRSLIVAFIGEFTQEKGYPPTVREVAEGVGRDVSTVHYALWQLRAKGLVTWEERKNRTLRLVA